MGIFFSSRPGVKFFSLDDSHQNVRNLTQWREGAKTQWVFSSLRVLASLR
jgi:hypothetical protein